MPTGRKSAGYLLDSFRRVKSKEFNGHIAICKACDLQQRWHSTKLSRHLEVCPKLQQQEDIRNGFLEAAARVEQTISLDGLNTRISTYFPAIII
jgi:hypothetical protein